MLDILVGDILVIGSTQYPIRFVGAWSGWGASSTFVTDANTAASTKRAPAISGGLRGDPATNIASLYVTPLDPAANDLQQRVITKAEFQLKECYAGDSSGFLRIAVESLK
ncbi:MAG: hypothetical protein V1899_03075 [Planctomycetota bacterium]